MDVERNSREVDVYGDNGVHLGSFKIKLGWETEVLLDATQFAESLWESTLGDAEDIYDLGRKTSLEELLMRDFGQNYIEGLPEDTEQDQVITDDDLRGLDTLVQTIHQNSLTSPEKVADNLEKIWLSNLDRAEREGERDFQHGVREYLIHKARQFPEKKWKEVLYWKEIREYFVGLARQLLTGEFREKRIKRLRERTPELDWENLVETV